jgi:hypothetical protein
MRTGCRRRLAVVCSSVARLVGMNLTDEINRIDENVKDEREGLG